MREIVLAGGCHRVRVDDCDYDRLNAYEWRLLRSRLGHPYAVRREGEATLFMHREILGLTEDDSVQVDHVDGDGLNNVRSNLRRATNQQNAWNQRPHRKRTQPAARHSRHKGVSWYANRWRARITVGGETQHLGRFETEREAALAYNSAARELFGEFARPNDVPRR